MSNKKKQPWTRNRIVRVIDQIHNDQIAMMKNTIHLRAFSSFYKRAEDIQDKTLRFVTAIVKSSDDNLQLTTEREIKDAYTKIVEVNDTKESDDGK